MIESVIDWLNSPDSDEWRRDTFEMINPLVVVKDDSVRTELELVAVLFYA